MEKAIYIVGALELLVLVYMAGFHYGGKKKNITINVGRLTDKIVYDTKNPIDNTIAETMGKIVSSAVGAADNRTIDDLPKCNCKDVNQCDTWCRAKANFTNYHG